MENDKLNKQRELLEKFVSMQDNNVFLTLEEGLAFERELAKAFMYQLDPDCSEEELFAWGAQFKSTIKQQVEMFRNGQLG